MGNHAYLIMAHKNDYTFHTLLKLLDDERNTIFIHMDKKVKDYDPAVVQQLVLKSQVIHTPHRWNIKWGGDIQIFLELMMMETALQKGPFTRYHLISGEDLPIKSQDEIHDFFDQHPDKEFIDFMMGDFRYRVQYYHLLQNKLGKKDEGLIAKANGFCIRLQQVAGVCRNKDILLAKGANWFSITEKCVNYLLSQKPRIRQIFRYTFGCDELFLQTMLLNTDFMNHLYQPEEGYNSILRQINWSDAEIPSPRVYKITDKDNLAASKNMFARKFDCKVDKEIIDYVAENLAVTKE